MLLCRRLARSKINLTHYPGDLNGTSVEQRGWWSSSVVWLKERLTGVRGGCWCWNRCPGSIEGIWERSGELEGSGETSSLEAHTVRQKNWDKDVVTLMGHLIFPQRITGDNLLLVTLIGFKIEWWGFLLSTIIMSGGQTDAGERICWLDFRQQNPCESIWIFTNFWPCYLWSYITW